MPCTPEAMVKAQMAAQAGSSGYHGDVTARSPHCGAAYSSPPLPWVLESRGPRGPTHSCSSSSSLCGSGPRTGVASVRHEMTHLLFAQPSLCGAQGVEAVLKQPGSLDSGG